MLAEHELIPYGVTTLPEGPWLVFAPHADDETFGMGGALLLAAAAGISTHIVVLTDGALGGEREDLVNIRKQELAAVCSFMGVTSVQCWDQPDRGLTASASLVEGVQQSLEAVEAASVFFPAPFEPHPDHRMTTELLWQALGERHNNAAARGVTGYAYEISVQSPVNVILDITTVIGQKRQAMELYNSQNAENDYPNLVIGLNKGRTFSLPDEVLFAEAFYRYPATAYSRSIEAYTLDIIKKYWE